VHEVDDVRAHEHSLAPRYVAEELLRATPEFDNLELVFPRAASAQVYFDAFE